MPLFSSLRLAKLNDEITLQIAGFQREILLKMLLTIFARCCLKYLFENEYLNFGKRRKTIRLPLGGRFSRIQYSEEENSTTFSLMAFG